MLVGDVDLPRGEREVLGVGAGVEARDDPVRRGVDDEHRLAFLGAGPPAHGHEDAAVGRHSHAPRAPFERHGRDDLVLAGVDDGERSGLLARDVDAHRLDGRTRKKSHRAECCRDEQRHRETLREGLHVCPQYYPRPRTSR